MVQGGLILEGGGMRGLFTAGILDFFLEKDLHFKSIYGVSAGACHACSYVSRQRDRARRTVIDYRRDWRYASFRSLLLTGDFFGSRFAYHEVPDKLLPFDHDTFRTSGSALNVVVTNCNTGSAEYLAARDLMTDINMIQASSSLPLLSRMVVVNGTPYLDGGISDSIPLARSIEEGNKKNIVILTRHKDYRKEKTGFYSLMKARYRHYPALLQAIATRHEKYNDTLDFIGAEEAGGSTFVIRPKEPIGIGRLEKDVEKLQALYDYGYEEAKSSFDSLINFLQTTDRRC